MFEFKTIMIEVVIALLFLSWFLHEVGKVTPRIINEAGKLVIMIIVAIRETRYRIKKAMLTRRKVNRKIKRYKRLKKRKSKRSRNKSRLKKSLD